MGDDGDDILACRDLLEEGVEDYPIIAVNVDAGQRQGSRSGVGSGTQDLSHVTVGSSPGQRSLFLIDPMGPPPSKWPNSMMTISSSSTRSRIS
jgi:hypothetical protein